MKTIKHTIINKTIYYFYTEFVTQTSNYMHVAYTVNNIKPTITLFVGLKRYDCYNHIITIFTNAFKKSFLSSSK